MKHEGLTKACESTGCLFGGRKRVKERQAHEIPKFPASQLSTARVLASWAYGKCQLEGLASFGGPFPLPNWGLVTT